MFLEPLDQRAYLFTPYTGVIKLYTSAGAQECFQHVCGRIYFYFFIEMEMFFITRLKRCWSGYFARWAYRCLSKGGLARWKHIKKPENIFNTREDVHKWTEPPFFITFMQATRHGRNGTNLWEWLDSDG